MNPCGVTRLVFLTISIPRTSSREHPQPLPRHTLADRPAHEINTPLRYSTARPKSGGELARVERLRRPRGQRRPKRPRRLRSKQHLGTDRPVRAGSGSSARSTRSEGRPRQRSGGRRVAAIVRRQRVTCSPHAHPDIHGAESGRGHQPRGCRGSTDRRTGAGRCLYGPDFR